MLKNAFRSTTEKLINFCWFLGSAFFRIPKILGRKKVIIRICTVTCMSSWKINLWDLGERALDPISNAWSFYINHVTLTKSFNLCVSFKSSAIGNKWTKWPRSEVPWFQIHLDLRSSALVMLKEIVLQQSISWLACILRRNSYNSEGYSTAFLA